MTFKRKAAGVQTDTGTKAERRSGGAWVPFDVIKRKSSGAWTVAWSRISISPQTIVVTRPTGIATAGYRLNASGIAEKLENLTYTTLGTWLVLGNAVDYEVRATLNAGTLTSGTTGTWLSLSSSNQWTVDDSIFDGVSADATITIEIRNASTLAVVDSATISLSAERI